MRNVPVPAPYITVSVGFVPPPPNAQFIGFPELVPKGAIIGLYEQPGIHIDVQEYDRMAMRILRLREPVFDYARQLWIKAYYPKTRRVERIYRPHIIAVFPEMASAKRGQEWFQQQKHRSWKRHLEAILAFQHARQAFAEATQETRRELKRSASLGLFEIDLSI